ncbi:hypothetical protein ACIBQ1_50150 [Nonomuraea sp. NPDC050153]|uniref:hypothetical protein n=1 Tax=Nonomuraea sp. NPDC050153 TaxID=3364359 RepID=UPI00378AA71D
MLLPMGQGTATASAGLPAVDAGGPPQPTPRKVTRVVQQAAPKVVSHEKPVFVPRPIWQRQHVRVIVDNHNRNLNRFRREPMIRHHHPIHHDVKTPDWSESEDTSSAE